jgi:hypothetical protein
MDYTVTARAKRSRRLIYQRAYRYPGHAIRGLHRVRSEYPSANVTIVVPGRFAGVQFSDPEDFLAYLEARSTP